MSTGRHPVLVYVYPVLIYVLKFPSTGWRPVLIYVLKFPRSWPNIGDSYGMYKKNSLFSCSFFLADYNQWGGAKAPFSPSPNDGSAMRYRRRIDGQVQK